MQAITTKFLGPTNSRGPRVKASAERGSITVHWDHRFNVESNHALAAKALAEKFGWGGWWVAGTSPNGCGYAYVAVGGVHTEEVTAKLEALAAFSTVWREDE